MSSAYVLVAFAVCILLMILFISKWKIHPVTSILVATIILAISIGTPWDKIEGIINKGMADTLKSIAIVIVLGCILGKVLEETGAAVSITKATVKLFGEKRVLWAILLASAILGIPIWADTVVILLIPIVSNLALQTNKSMMSYGTALYMGALGISPLAAFLACGTGALMFKHANSSGFWVTVTMSNMDIRQGIRAVGGGSTVAGVTGAAITVILRFAGII